MRIVAVCLSLALVSCGASGERPQRMFMPDMVESVPFDAFDPHPETSNGQTLMLPPEGTVPIGFTPFLYGEGADEAVRAGEDLNNPYAATPENLQRGRRVYETMCLVCHGATGEGDGPIIGRFPNPPSLVARRTRFFPDGRIFHVITRGQGIMPPHAVQVRPADRWKVILYLRGIQEEVSQQEVTP